MSDEYLEHYGVLGMKWGQHRATKATRRSNIKLGKKSSGVLGKMEAQKIKDYYKGRSKTAARAGALGGGIAGTTLAVATASKSTVIGATLATAAVGGSGGAVAVAAIAGTAVYMKGRKEVNNYFERQGKIENKLNS